jgi:urease accessory protein
MPPCRYDSPMHPTPSRPAGRPASNSVSPAMARRHAAGPPQPHGPLRVQKALYPEGPELCHAIVLHPPAGIAGGDRLEFDITLDTGAQALLTTPGAGKWYRSAGPLAEQQVAIKVGAGATAEWLPQESIVFAGAQARMRTEVDLAPGARYIGLETLCFGRRASGETFRARPPASRHRHPQRRPLALARAWHHRRRLATARFTDRPGRLQRVQHRAGGRYRPAGETLAACRNARQRTPARRPASAPCRKLFVGRYLGHSAEAAREWFVTLWQHLRPIVVGREAAVPRIWNT